MFCENWIWFPFFSPICICSANNRNIYLASLNFLHRFALLIIQTLIASVCVYVDLFLSFLFLPLICLLLWQYSVFKLLSSYSLNIWASKFSYCFPFQNCLAILCPLHIHINFTVSFSSSRGKKPIGNLTGIALILSNSFGGSWHLYNTESSNRKMWYVSPFV